MFCERCGRQLPDNAEFCPGCGLEFESKVLDNMNKEPVFEVRPTFKFSYVVLPKLLKELIFIIPMILVAIYFISSITKISNSYSNNMNNPVEFTVFMPIIFICVGIPLIRIIFILGKSILDKKQYENYIYTFYSDKVIFRDSFLNVSEKELKYKNIREIAKRQTFIQRYFNIGNIVLFSNAETGFVSGVFMVNIENVDDVYRKIKEITNV